MVVFVIARYRLSRPLAGAAPENSRVRPPRIRPRRLLRAAALALLAAACGAPAPAPREASEPGLVPEGDGVPAFRLDATEVTHADFASFVERTGHRTDAEEFGWSLVFHPPGAEPEGAERVPGAPWWVRVEGADWRTPRGPSGDPPSPAHPVTQVSWNDAAAYCEAAGGRLPTGEEWERAARGGRDGAARFVWGDRDPFSGGPAPANLWDGRFPHPPPGGAGARPRDGYAGIAPVGEFPANAYGLHDLAGNVWEWIAGGSPGDRRLRGGSFLCAENSCRGYRLDWTNRASADSAWDHAGFRCRFAP